ncbi:MAG: hypothetical protein ABJC19_10375 [Gemmatimonadota bacterium]
MCTLVAPAEATDQTLRIGIIDFYGLNGAPADRARAALTFTEGDIISLKGGGRPASFSASEARLATLPRIARARINLVCCDDGRGIIYVGIQQQGSVTMPFRGAPVGDAELAADIVRAGDEFSKALMLAVQRGEAAEDRTQGHSLALDPAMRAIQDRFIVYANRDLLTLRDVLRNSRSAAQRALAAQVLGYATDKSAVAADLSYGMSDPSEAVRNNAMRALMVMAEMTPSAERAAPHISPQPFIALLHSPVWSDRNKAAGALEVLTRPRDRGVLDALTQAIDPLVEMARWRSEGHALSAFLVLARIANYSDEAAFDLWKRGEREVVIMSILRE